MNCNFDKDLIQRYLDNSIDPLELIVLKEHIAVCQDCKLELELMSKLETSMIDYFANVPMSENLEQFSMMVLEECYEESGRMNYLQGVVKAWEINKMVASNAVRYTDYLPGSKIAVRTAKKAGNHINKAVKSYMKNSLKKLVAEAMK